MLERVPTLPKLNFERLHLPCCPSIHFIGIGGIGMSGLAKLLHEMGVTVTGSDQTATSTLEYLRCLGISTQVGHAVELVIHADIVVYSSAIGDTNAELQWAKQLQKPIWHRAQLLQFIISSGRSIAISGTHGKSSTTAILAHIFRTANIPHTLINGAVCNDLGTNAYFDPKGPILFEADESDGSFLNLYPTVAIATNLEADHLNHYNEQFEDLRKAYLQFLSQVDANGFIVLCGDDPVLRTASLSLPRRSITYGFQKDTDYQLLQYSQWNMQAHAILRCPSQKELSLKLNVPGRHHALNAAAAIAVAHRYGCSDQAIAKALATYPGIRRRLQCLGLWRLSNGHFIRCFSDYGHHPTEIDYVREALRTSWPRHRLLHIFEPHRYSRNKLLASEFVNSLKTVDELILIETYAAGETSKAGTSSFDLARRIDQYRSSPTPIFPATSDWFDQLYILLNKVDLLLFQGAGYIGEIAEAFAQYLSTMGAKCSFETLEE